MARRSGLGALVQDFRDFLNRGNVVDLAIAVVLGGAFGKVVDAVVSLVMGAALAPTLRALNVDQISAWPAGAVLVALINFVVIAAVAFAIVRALESLKRRERQAAAAAPDPQLQLAAAAQRLAEAIEARGL